MGVEGGSKGGLAYMSSLQARLFFFSAVFQFNRPFSKINDDNMEGKNKALASVLRFCRGVFLVIFGWFTSLGFQFIWVTVVIDSN